MGKSKTVFSIAIVLATAVLWFVEPSRLWVNLGFSVIALLVLIRIWVQNKWPLGLK